MLTEVVKSKLKGSTRCGFYHKCRGEKEAPRHSIGRGRGEEDGVDQSQTEAHRKS